MSDLILTGLICIRELVTVTELMFGEGSNNIIARNISIYGHDELQHSLYSKIKTNFIDWIIKERLSNWDINWIPIGVNFLSSTLSFQ
ncbi:MAG: hypothetical protein A3F11_11745 [Gammaproteobacteria bacterium RIFCSPHIGHO2_12_FULL_37_14]|nr:MAG: hypothetical protein A3F11_11745 [Gammaproteobacteria bacterium RIFCSPHIGHO2_12_FULL_37_14]